MEKIDKLKKSWNVGLKERKPEKQESESEDEIEEMPKQTIREHFSRRLEAQEMILLFALIFLIVLFLFVFLNPLDNPLKEKRRDLF